MSSLYSIVAGKLKPATRRALMKESLIEDWVAADPSLLGLDAMVIGRQVSTCWRWMPQGLSSSSS